MAIEIVIYIVEIYKHIIKYFLHINFFNILLIFYFSDNLINNIEEIIYYQILASM